MQYMSLKYIGQVEFIDTISFKPQEVYEVQVETAKNLLETFPVWFEDVTPKVKETKEVKDVKVDSKKSKE